MVLNWDWESITDIELDPAEGEALHFQRVPESVRSDGSTLFSDWELVQDRAFDLDQGAVTAMARNLSVLRSGAVLSAEFDAGWDPPASTMTLRTLDGASVTMSFGQDSVESAAFVRLDPSGSVYRVAGGAREATLQPQTWWRNRQIFDIPGSEVVSLTLVDIQGRRVLTRSEDGLWIITEPRNVDTDSKQAGFTVNTLRDLRADGIVEVDLEDAGLVQPSQTITIELTSGAEVDLLVGRSFQDQQGRVLHYVKRSDGPIVYGLRDGRGTSSGLSHIRRGFGRAE
jgi:hypothetical protein